MKSKTSSTPVVLIAALAMGATLWVGREARGDAGNPVLTVPFSGKVKGATESVSFSGEARLKTSVAKDTDFGDPASVTIYINLKGVTATGSSGKKYEVSGEQQIVRPLQESDTVELVFMYYPAGSEGSTETASATFRLRLDPKNGALLRADGSIGGE